MPNQRLNIDLQLILHDFLKKLREEGFSIGMNTYIESTQLLHWFLLERKSNSIEDFSSYLSPLICKHDDEQRRFKSLFDRYISKSFNDVIESERIKLANERKELRRKYFIGVGVVLALLLLTWVVVNILRHEHNFKSEKFAEQEFLYHRNQPVDFDRSILF